MKKERSALLTAAAFTGFFFSLLFCRVRGVGINSPVFAAVLIACFVYAAKRFESHNIKRSLPYAAGLFLLAVGDFLTTNQIVQRINELGIIILSILMIIECFCDSSDWQFGEYIHSGVYFVFSALRKLPEPAAILFRRGGEKSRTSKYVILGLAASVPLVLIILPLLASADPVFNRLIERIFIWKLNEAARSAISAVLLFAAAFLGFYCGVSGTYDLRGGSERKTRNKVEPLIAVTATGVLAVIYAVFCAIQISCLFSGGKCGLPEGFTYSSYARQGFFQLLFVSLLNVALVIACSGVFKRSRALDILLTAVSACTYILVASSAYRMALYVGAYGLTFLRLFTLMFLALLTAAMTGTLVFIWNRRFSLFRFCLFICLAIWLCFSFSRPDRIAAEYNAERFGLSEDIASLMLYELSMDAVPVMARYEFEDVPVALRGDWESYLTNAVEEDYDFYGARSFNLALFEAKNAVSDRQQARP